MVTLLARERSIEMLMPDGEDFLSLVTLGPYHGDPFDRLIIVQAIGANATIMTEDSIMARYPVRTIPCR